MQMAGYIPVIQGTGLFWLPNNELLVVTDRDLNTPAFNILQSMEYIARPYSLHQQSAFINFNTQPTEGHIGQICNFFRRLPPKKKD